MMVQVPSGELAGRDSAWDCIEQPKYSFGKWPPPFKNRVMHDLVQKDREIENRQTLNQRERHPNERILEANQSPGGDCQDGELSSCDREVPPRGLAVQLAHLVARDSRAQLSSECNRVLGVVVGLHGYSSILAGIHSGGLIGLTLVSATPISTPAAPTIFRLLKGSFRNRVAVTMATTGTRFEYTDVRALPICRTAAYQIV